MPASFDRHDGANNAGANANGGQPETDAQGDFRGRYGYGRPAHGSDPNARYGFDLDVFTGRRPR